MAEHSKQFFFGMYVTVIKPFSFQSNRNENGLFTVTYIPEKNYFECLAIIHHHRNSSAEVLKNCSTFKAIFFWHVCHSN
jgi:hypothetical protein